MKTMLVTGATDGIGRAAARQLGLAGARVLVHGRTIESARETADTLTEVTAGAFEPVAGDFARLEEVRALAAEVMRRGRLAGRGVTVNALHPGVIGTKLLHHGFGGAGGDDVERGAAGEVKLATDAALDGVTGRYFNETEESRSSRASHDVALQKRVYEMS